MSFSDSYPKNSDLSKVTRGKVKVSSKFS